MVKEELNSLGKAKASIQTNDTNRMASSFENDPHHSRADLQDSFQKKEAIADSTSRQAATANKITPQPLFGEVPSSKIISDVQIVKEIGTKLDTAITEEFTGKVVKVDGGNIDSGLPSFHNQTTDKAYETASTTKEIESNNAGLRSQTMDQIVKKALILLRNGHNEAKIDLKPDHLGHIRMQVITESHQVTVKILAELPFVKDMIETHMQQLKAQLQQQGLEVDMLEVSISRDSDGFDHTRENASRLKVKSRRIDEETADNFVEEALSDTGSSATTIEASSTIDYFA
jgi:flagellar hook-length control protein FliK